MIFSKFSFASEKIHFSTFYSFGVHFCSSIGGVNSIFLAKPTLHDVKGVPLRNSEKECSGICCCFEKRCLLNLTNIWPCQFARGSTTGSTLVPPACRDRGADDYDRTKRASDSRHASQGGRGPDGLWRIIL